MTQVSHEIFRGKIASFRSLRVCLYAYTEGVIDCGDYFLSFLMIEMVSKLEKLISADEFNNR